MSEIAFLERLAEEILSEAERMAAVRSHIFGFRPIGNGHFAIVPEEAEIISTVINQLADIPFLSCARILELISEEFRTATPQVRNRSRRLWSPRALAALVQNPLCCGCTVSPLGFLQRVENFPAVVEPAKYKRCLARLKREGMVSNPN